MEENKFAVIGLGLFGLSIARTLSQRGAEVLAIDCKPENVEAIKDEVAYAVTLDATDVKALQAQNIEEMDAVVVAIGENFEGLLLCTVLLQDLNINRIITRGSTVTQRTILSKMGVDEILAPEDEVGFAVAQRLLNPDIFTFIELPDDHKIAEIKAPRGVINKTLGEIKLRENYHLNLITIKRWYEEAEGNDVTLKDHIIGVPKATTAIFKDDTLILMGLRADIQKFLEINK